MPFLAMVQVVRALTKHQVERRMWELNSAKCVLLWLW